ncbi:hypothetical protein M2171_004277 [Bradyrhizobium japonicum USDA 38]|nr:hypothetical protein [Bradyrhizobium japonicum USDA 38]MCS3947659.1 hypothetical protein [Bradyrhizobium japonicum]
MNSLAIQIHLRFQYYHERTQAKTVWFNDLCI